ncbi:MAG: sulfite exporter TauE/SafE family protein [Pseudomonadales bacterium]|nr:sulfite exporter TauE/SafE family protein [Pseudomonadales bacterium]
MSALEQLILFFASLVANTLSALAGGGAGLLQLPILLFLGLAFSSALTTHKIASVALGIGATLRHAKEHSLNYRFALFILACGLPGVVTGALTILKIDDHTAKLALGILTTGLGLYSLFKAELGQTHTLKNRTRLGYLLGGLVLFIIGSLNGSLTSGTGLFVTLWLVRWFGLDYKTAVAYTLILVGLFWNGFGALTLAFQAEIKWSWLPALLTGSLLGGFAGAHLSIIKGNRWVKRCFEALTLLVGLKLIWDATLPLQ